MHKALAEIIAAPIPHKMTRNRWRGLLRYGLRAARRLKKEIRANTSAPQHYLSVCAITKDEGPYLAEWIDWHHRHGVEKFYIYDNESSDTTRAVLAPYIAAGIVDYKYWEGYRKQLAAYDDCLARHRYAARWIAFIDIDEFIVPLQDATIPAFLRRCEAFAAVEINWLIYGSNGMRTRTQGGVMARFTAHALPSHPLNRYVKSIVDPRRVYTMIGCHEAARIEGYAGDSHGQRITRHFRQRAPQHDIIRINHYAVRSYEEFAEKQARGRASGRARHITQAYFLRYDLNDIHEG